MEKEIWKDVKGYEGIYKVSSHGRIKSFKGIKPKLLKPRQNGKGYLLIALFSENKKRNDISIHRLVAINFIENPKNLPEINHIDEIKSNNFSENLEWITRKGNINYGNAQKKRSKKRHKKIDCFDLNGNLVKTYNSMKETAMDGFEPTSVSACCRGRYKTTNNFKFKYH